MNLIFLLIFCDFHEDRTDKKKEILKFEVDHIDANHKFFIVAAAFD